MDELDSDQSVLSPMKFLCRSAATGQDAVKTAVNFDKHVQITGKSNNAEWQRKSRRCDLDSRGH